jgi:predicted nucleic acid-binding protein
MTSRMPEIIIIADASCLIALTNINALWILESLYKKVFITQTILEEYALPIPDFIKIKEVNNLNIQRVLSGYLDLGEASAIALGIENPDSIFILHDLKGRKEAQKLNIRFTGTLGVLIKAKKENYITDVNSYFTALKDNGFRISDKIIELAIKESNR